MLRRSLLILVLLSCAAETLHAQSFYSFRRNRTLMVNLGSGTANYKGEMVNPGEWGFVKPNITVGAEMYFLPRVSARAQLTWFQIKGDDATADNDRWQRNLSFTSSCIEFSAVGLLSLSPQGERYYERPRLNIHGFAGIGLLYFNPKATFEGEKYALRSLKTEGVGYSRVQPVIPLGLGARIHVSPLFNVLIEGGYRFTFTDYLDDVSKRRYMTPEQLGVSGEESITYKLHDRRAEVDTQPATMEERVTEGVRGNPEENDGYFILNLSVQYYLPTDIFKNTQRKLYTVKRKSYYRRPARRR
jgi:hypothetical protein